MLLIFLGGGIGRLPGQGWAVRENWRQVEKMHVCPVKLVALAEHYIITEHSLLAMFCSSPTSPTLYSTLVCWWFWSSERILKWQKKALRNIFKLHPKTSCRELFKSWYILTAPGLHYILEIVSHIKSNNLSNTSIHHNHNARFKDHHMYKRFLKKKTSKLNK